MSNPRIDRSGSRASSMTLALSNHGHTARAEGLVVK